jgi:hypothetical protein
MPEGRMLKKCISESKSLGNLSSDSARLLYTWLIPFLDVEGRYSADPEIIKGHIFPKIKSMTISKIQKLLSDLNTAGLIILYNFNDEVYLQLTKFHEHQKLDPTKEGKSKIPAPKLEDIENKATPEDSRVTPEKSSLSKDKLSKDKLREEKAETKSFDFLFEEFWKIYPKKIAKDYAKEKFMILARQGLMPNLIKATNGYLDFLKHRKIKDNFEQEPLNPATFLMKNRWKDFVDFKYEAPL